MPRMRVPKLYSPYGPRLRRSAQLTVLWMAVLVAVLITTFYLTARERERAATANLQVPVGKEAKEEGKEASRGIARMISKMVP